MRNKKNDGFYCRPYWAIGHYNEYGRANYERDKARIKKEKAQKAKEEEQEM